MIPQRVMAFSSKICSTQRRNGRSQTAPTNTEKASVGANCVRPLFLPISPPCDMINKKAVKIVSNQPIDFEQAEFALRQSWEAHRQAFGPILEPAFVENQQVRILLINALNHISRRDVKRGMELLKEIHPHCIYDEDKAAWAFFVGLCFEMGGICWPQSWAEPMRPWYFCLDWHFWRRCR